MYNEGLSTIQLAKEYEYSSNLGATKFIDCFGLVADSTCEFFQT